jgi:hypothetical protein
MRFILLLLDELPRTESDERIRIDAFAWPWRPIVIGAVDAATSSGNDENVARPFLEQPRRRPRPTTPRRALTAPGYDYEVRAERTLLVEHLDGCTSMHDGVLQLSFERCPVDMHDVEPRLRCHVARASERFRWRRHQVNGDEHAPVR